MMKTSGSLAWLYPFQYVRVPLLGAIYPALFHYANNARLVLLSSFIELCILLAGAALVIYVLLVLLSRSRSSQSALGALLIVVFFMTYRLAYDWLRSMDRVQLETYNFMPFWVFVALYLAWVVTGLPAKTSIWICNFFTLIAGILAIFNLVRIIPIEIEKNRDAAPVHRSITSDGATIANQQYPDIYYLVFDEAASFEAARQYWNYNEVDTFVTYLEMNGFYVAEESHGGSIHTLRELSSRLNYKEYPVGNEYFEVYQEAIGNNSVMSFLKAHGYTLIAYDQRRTPYPTMLPVPVDILIEESPERGTGRLILLDDYKILVLENSLAGPFLNQDRELLRHRDMILYTAENIASEQISSPKFVYAHLMLPHGPFVFSEEGSVEVSRQTEYTNWQRYLENYKFFLHVAREMVGNILLASQGHAVIIVQSDHGARNFTHGTYTGFLQNYPEIYKTWIINAFYLPGCDDAPLTQDIKPINTFPIVFNCYFDENIPIK